GAGAAGAAPAPARPEASSATASPTEVVASNSSFSSHAAPSSLVPTGPIIWTHDAHLGLIEGVDTTGSGMALASFDHFPLYTLDYNAGTILFPGHVQRGGPGGGDLRAQVRNTTGSTSYTYSWDTSGLTKANSITGTNTYR